MGVPPPPPTPPPSPPPGGGSGGPPPSSGPPPSPPSGGGGLGGAPSGPGGGGGGGGMDAALSSTPEGQVLKVAIKVGKEVKSQVDQLTGLGGQFVDMVKSLATGEKSDNQLTPENKADKDAQKKEENPVPLKSSEMPDVTHSADEDLESNKTNKPRPRKG